MSAAPAQGVESRRVAPVRSRQTFDRLQRSPKRGRAGPVTVAFLEELPSSEHQFAYAVSRSVGTAVVRNRLRRRMRAIVADASPALPVGAYLVGTRPEAAGLDFEELKVVMWRALERATAGGTDRHGPAPRSAPPLERA